MSIPQGEYPTQLRMVWPAYLLDACPTVQLPPGYRVRPYQDGDEPRFFTVMELAGWPGWDADRLGPWQQRLLPQSWFMVVHEDSHELVATGMALKDCCEFGQQGGEIGWIAVDPAHRGQGLGFAISAAATRRLIQEGYRHIHLYTEDWRLAALKTYLKLGYIPLLYAPDMMERWRSVCSRLQWPFTPERWLS